MVQQADGADHHVEALRLAVGRDHFPGVGGFVPGAALHAGVEAEVGRHPESVCRALQVALQLGLLDVGAREVERGKAERVKRLWGIDLGARVDVVPPRTARAGRLLEDRVLPYADPAQGRPHADPPRPRTDDRHPRRGVRWRFTFRGKRHPVPHSLQAMQLPDRLQRAMTALQGPTPEAAHS